jgi:hypothetical protein
MANIDYIRGGILNGKTKHWSEVLDLYRKTPLAEQLKMKLASLKRKAADPKQFTFEDMAVFAELIGISLEEAVLFNARMMKAQNAQ